MGSLAATAGFSASTCIATPGLAVLGSASKSSPVTCLFEFGFAIKVSQFHWSSFFVHIFRTRSLVAGPC